MKIKAAFFVAIRYLWGRAHEGGRYLRGAAAGIAISLVPIIVTLIVADGMIRGIMDRYLEFGTGHLQIYSVSDLMLGEEVKTKVKETDGVRGVWAEQRGMGVLAGKTGRTGVTVRAIETSFWSDPGSIHYLNIIEGETQNQSDREIVLGEALASGIGVTVGDSVRLMTIREGENGRLIPRSASFTVKGIISCGYNELDALWCILSWEGGLRVLSDDQSSASLLVKIDDPYNVSDHFIWDMFMKLGNGFIIYTWKDLLRSQHSSYETTRQLLLFIMALIVVVAAVNVSSATSMLVLERQKDIAVLKFSGATVKGVAGVFILGGFLTGLFGSIIGIAAGLLIGVNINILIRSLEKFLSFLSGLFNGGKIIILDPDFYLETIPIIIDWGTVILIGIFAVFCSVLSSWIPAHRAGKLKPMELLRKT